MLLPRPIINKRASLLPVDSYSLGREKLYRLLTGDEIVYKDILDETCCRSFFSETGFFAVRIFFGLSFLKKIFFWAAVSIIADNKKSEQQKNRFIIADFVDNKSSNNKFKMQYPFDR